MRLGCLGCLTFLALLAAVVGGVWIGARTLQEPALATAETSAADGVRAQQKILEIAHGKTESTGRVVLTEREVNAFLARHLAGAADLPLTGIAVRLRGDGVVEFTGRLPLRRGTAAAAGGAAEAQPGPGGAADPRVAPPRWHRLGHDRGGPGGAPARLVALTYRTWRS